MANKRTPERVIDAAYHAIADGVPVAWAEIEQHEANTAQVEVLRLLDDVAQAYGSANPGEPVGHRNIAFRWGALEVEAAIGAGTHGDVYRAFDPWLGRTVALKLFPTSGGAGAGLEEARRLARLRHRNVLSVYGCAIHDGRAGLWSELIEGRTLAAILTEDGPFSAEEGMRIGYDLAQALAIVHGAGLVHGDVKAENVMRERGGRVVLMDFGAGGEPRLLAGRRLLTATPRYLPPETLDGMPLSKQSDVYALGVLLFYMLVGQYPYPETDVLALREAQRRGRHTTLRELRPELAEPLCSFVESCIAVEPEARTGDAHAVAARLSQLLHGSFAVGRDKLARRLALSALLSAVVVLAAVLAWSRVFPPTWQSGVKLLRVTPTGNVELDASSVLHNGDRLRMMVDSTRTVYVYVLNEDAAGNATVLFPGAEGVLSNPLPAGNSLQLPGGRASTLAWEVTADSAAEEFVVVAALQQLPDLDAELTAWRRATAVDRTRAVGALADAPTLMLQGEHLRRILIALARDPERVHVWQYRFAHHE